MQIAEGIAFAPTCVVHGSLSPLADPQLSSDILARKLAGVLLPDSPYHVVGFSGHAHISLLCLFGIRMSAIRQNQNGNLASRCCSHQWWQQ